MKKILFLLVLILFSVSLSAEVMDYKTIYKEAAPGVVLLFGSVGQVGSTGTGAIIDESGRIITNAHVVINSSTHLPYKNLTVFLKPEKVTGKNKDDLKYHYKAKVIEYDEDMDLAVVQIIGLDKKLTTIVIANSKDILVGEPTVAIGHPEQGSRWSLTTGAISGRIEDFNGIKGKNVFQMETAVNRGNSGGPLLDYRGYMIGINSMIARESKDGLAIVGINFAIDSNSISKWMKAKKLAVAIVNSDGNEVEYSKEDYKNSKKSSLFVLDSKNEKMDGNLKPSDKKIKTQKIRRRKKLNFRIKSTRKYKKRSKKPIFKQKYKPGYVYTEKDIDSGVTKRKKKAHKKLDKKLGSFDDDEVPGFENADSF